MNKQACKHTPGPWTAEHDYKPYVIGPVGGNHVCSITGTAAIVPEAQANARLIAAAPELLGALHDIQRIGREDFGPAATSRMVDIARSAIAKAT